MKINDPLKLNDLPLPVIPVLEELIKKHNLLVDMVRKMNKDLDIIVDSLPVKRDEYGQLELIKYKCVYCQNYFANITKDHIIPKSKFPKGIHNVEENNVLSCEECNQKKSDLFPHEIQNKEMRDIALYNAIKIDWIWLYHVVFSRI